MVFSMAREVGEQIGEAQKDAIRNRETPALMGKRRSDGSLTLRGDDVVGDRIYTPDVYVRLWGLDNELKIAKNLKVTAKTGLDVMVEQYARGKWRVTGLNDDLAVSAGGEQVLNYASPPRAGGSDDIFRERALMAGRLRLYSASSMLITADPFLYEDTAGVLKVADPDELDALDLTSNIPGSGLQRYVYVSFDPDATTPVFVATNGSTQSSSTPLGRYDYTSIVVPVGHIPLGPVRLVNGDTALTEDRFFDGVGKKGWPGRMLLNKMGTPVGTLFEIDSILTDADGNILVDANGNVLLGA